MKSAAAARRRRLGRGALAALALMCAVASPLRAQDPPPPARDTMRVPAQADTVPADTVIPPAVRFPALPTPRVSAAGTEWVWDREALLRTMAVSLTDLLERIPGITTFQGGTFVQPEAASAFGAKAGRVEIDVDGYRLDPLAASTFDLSQVSLAQLREVRVERRLDVLRIILTTEFPVEGRPYTRVEAGIGVPEANMFRGMFLVPHVIRGPLALGVERLEADGVNRNEPAGVFNGWAKWAWTDGERGVQLELLRGSMRREPDSPWLVDRVRQDIIVRARNRFSNALAAEAYIGYASLDETIPAADATSEDISIDRSSIQAGLRAGVALPHTDIGAALRYRSNEHLPVGEGVVDVRTSLGPVRLDAEAGATVLYEVEPMSWLNVRGEAGRLYGLSVFGEVTRSTRSAPVFTDPLDGILFTKRTGWRAGASLDLGRASGTIAYLSLDQSVGIPFGLPFDSAGTLAALSAPTAIEAHGRVVIWPDHLTLSSWITDWRDIVGWPLLPSRAWRTALELHWIPLTSGNLEIYGRAEAHMRGSMLAWDPAPEDGTPALLAVPAFTTADAYLQIRIIDVRIFARWEDIVPGDREELPGRLFRGPRILYGVKWQLWN